MLTRPRHPSGFVRKHPDTSTTRWQAIVKYPDPENPDKWKQQAKTFARKAEAQKWVDDRLVEHRKNPHYRPTSRETVGEFLTRWLMDVAEARVRASTFRRYRVVGRHVIDNLGHTPLAQLQPRDLQGLYTHLQKEGQSARSVIFAHFIIRKALADAVAWGLLAMNPADRAVPPRLSAREIVPPTIEQAQAFLRVAESERLYALWAFLALSGVRKGEALALQWGDINWKARTVTIQRTMVGEAGTRSTNPPKTKRGRRVISLSPYLVDILRQHQQRQQDERLAAGSRWEEGNWVFTTRSGKWLSPRNVHRRFKQLLSAANLPGTTRIHDLRHAMATFWLTNGVPVKVVSERLGHSSIAITLQVYGHVLPHMQAQAARVMDAEILGKQTAQQQTRGQAE
ncbi:MAG: site-specific integrase [Thermaerobacter sp.]|nr:site-specific integrase [Thermaerobacter sp.]